MPRAKGHDKKATKRLEGLELVKFNLRLMPDELKLVRLRITQAIRRDDGLRNLLEPAGEEIEQLLGWMDEADEALSRIS